MSLVAEAYPALVLNADFRPLSYFPLSLWSWQDAIKAVFLDRGFDTQGILQRTGERFITNNVHTVLKRLASNVRVRIVRCHDGYELDTFVFRKCSLRSNHLLEVGVGAVLGEAKFDSKVPGGIGIAAERAGDQFDPAGHFGGKSVD